MKCLILMFFVLFLFVLYFYREFSQRRAAIEKQYAQVGCNQYFIFLDMQSGGISRKLDI